jgi:hypothetical protein
MSPRCSNRLSGQKPAETVEAFDHMSLVMEAKLMSQARQGAFLTVDFGINDRLKSSDPCEKLRRDVDFGGPIVIGSSDSASIETAPDCAVIGVQTSHVHHLLIRDKKETFAVFLQPAALHLLLLAGSRAHESAL